MKKTFLFLAALAMSAMTMAAEQTLTFDLSKNPGGWPTANSKTLTNYTYTLEGVDYTFGLSNVKCNSGYTMFTATAVMGLPAIEGYKLTKVVAKNTSGCSTAVKVGISSSSESANYISGGDAQTWSKQSSSYTYELDETSDNTVYYLYVTNKNAQVTELELTYTDGTSPTVTLDSLYIKGQATKMEYEVGEAFDPAGLEVWGIYTKTVKHDSISQIKSGITWTLDPETFAEASDNASVTLVASYKELTTADTTITGIKVNAPAPLPKYATIYTSNVTLSTTGGTSATEAKVVVAKGDTVDALKAGTGSAAGVLVVNIPAATKTLHFHVVGWNGKSVELDINGEALAITSDAGISNNSPFTLKGTASDYYYAIDPKGATTITFTATKDNRFVLFGVNAELQEGVIAAPAFTPTDTDFDGSVEVTLTCETEGAEIFYALNEEVTSMNATKYTEPIKLTETTTIYAVAKKDGKESAQASKTYTLIPTYTLAELVAAGAPTADKKKVILVLEKEVITGIDGTRGIYVKSGDQEIEIFCYNLPTTAVKGGTVSGRAMGDWFLYGTKEPKTWELQPADWSWATFAAPGDPTSLNNMNASKKAVKQVVNGQIVIVRDGKAYNVLGF